MTLYCHSLLSEGMFKFTCPAIIDSCGICGREWPYFVVRHVACLSKEEKAKFETSLSENYLKREIGIQQCPGCKTYCYRNDKSKNRVTCPICTHENRKSFEFCWVCLHKWMGRDSKICGNSDCDGTDKRIGILAKCGTKNIGQHGKKCEIPTMRGCAKCGILIEYKTNCKHMTCKMCKYEFCFACLKPRPANGKWVCTAYGNECGIAVSQTSLPGD